jgi:hypothetical protein
MACIIYLSLSIYIHMANLAADSTGAQSQEHLQTLIERTWRCTWRPRSSEFGDSLGGRDRVELRDALGGCDRVGLVMHLEAEIE